ncbi:MAG: plasmid pRiA4b ORF-3 family protein [Peptococcaceae bacterium]|nr:plasmid pRiA4b ORF-3 family protein [Peptococcaceae bacterium]
MDIELVLVENNAKRKIRVGANITFERLHKILQAAYNWHEAHLYQFLLFKNGEEGEQPSVEIVTDKEESLNPKIAKLVHRAKLSDYLDEYKHIVYIYDFGDGWTHYIDVVGKIDECSDDLPLLLNGENDSPPEDCGGAEGFVDFLKIIRKPRHKEHKEMKEWAIEQGWAPFDFRRVKLRVWLAGNPGRGVWIKEGSNLW